MSWLQSGAGWPKAATIVYARILKAEPQWEKSNEHVRKQIKRRKIRKMGWLQTPEADTKGVGGQQQLLMLGYAFYLQTPHPMQATKQQKTI